MDSPEFYYVTLIDAPCDHVWRALTNGEFTKQYWHQTEVVSTWTKGSKVEFLVKTEDGVVVGCEGEVLEMVEHELLSYSWHFPLNPSCAGEAPSRVTFELANIAGATKLTVRHDRFPHVSSATYKLVRDGWPFVLAGLKTLCETGRTKDFSMLEVA